MFRYVRNIVYQSWAEAQLAPKGIFMFRYARNTVYQLLQGYLGTRTEFLLPQIRKPIVLEEFPYITARMNNPKWSEEALRAKIIAVGSWEYHFAFSYGLTTRIHSTFNDRSVDFHRFRSKLISETIADLLGSELGQSSILDLACHCGVMALDMGFRGAGSVHGIEIRRKNLSQAEFLRDYYGIRNVTFEQGDVYQLDPDLKADVIMCLGILYHVVQPVDLIEFCYRNCTKFAVIETICHKYPIPAYVVVGDKNPESPVEGTRSIEFHPTYRGVIETMREAGFKDIVEVVGTCDTPIELFSQFTRRCFIGFKDSDLSKYQKRVRWN